MNITPLYYRVLSTILIVSLGAMVYSNAFYCSYHFDDLRFIVGNGVIRNFNDWPNIWHFWHSRFVVFLSLALNYKIGGLNVFGYHLFNLMVHELSAIFVWWFVNLTLLSSAMKEKMISGQSDIIALFAALIFVAHPLQTEAVTNIWQRCACLAALFYLASLCFYIKARMAGRWESYYYFSSLITAIVAMFTKENAVTLPLMILAYEIIFLNPKKGRKVYGNPPGNRERIQNRGHA